MSGQTVIEPLVLLVDSSHSLGLEALRTLRKSFDERNPNVVIIDTTQSEKTEMRSSMLSIAAAMMLGAVATPMEQAVASRFSEDMPYSRYGRSKRRPSSSRPSGAAAAKRASRKARNVAKNPRGSR